MIRGGCELRDVQQTQRDDTRSDAVRGLFFSTAAAVTMCMVTAAFAGEIPSYTKSADAQVKCEDEPPSKRAIRGCTDLEKQPETDPVARIRTYTMRGFAWLKDEAPLAAVSDFSRVIKIDPTNPSAYKGRAWAYERLHQYGDAIKDWTKLIEMKPDDAELHRERAYTYNMDRNFEKAVADFTRVLELDNDNLDSRIGRAIAYDAMDKLPDALANFESALKKNPKYTAVYIARAEMWERRGKVREAIADYKDALKLGSASQRVQRALKRLGVTDVPRRRLSE